MKSANPLHANDEVVKPNPVDPPNAVEDQAPAVHFEVGRYATVLVRWGCRLYEGAWASKVTNVQHGLIACGGGKSWPRFTVPRLP